MKRQGFFVVAEYGYSGAESVRREDSYDLAGFDEEDMGENSTVDVVGSWSIVHGRHSYMEVEVLVLEFDSPFAADKAIAQWDIANDIAESAGY